MGCGVYVMMIVCSTDAEALLEIANAIRSNPGKLVFADHTVDDVFLARCKLALDFSKLSAGVKFRAMFEGWNLARITQEIY
jgi:hypothetical protein